MEIVEGENGTNQDEFETPSADSTTSGETERPDGMELDESVENVDLNSQISQAQRDYQAQVENYVPSEPSRDGGSAPSGAVGAALDVNTNGDNIENDSATDDGSFWDVEDVVSGTTYTSIQASNSEANMETVS